MTTKNLLNLAILEFFGRLSELMSLMCLFNDIKTKKRHVKLQETDKIPYSRLIFCRVTRISFQLLHFIHSSSEVIFYLLSVYMLHLLNTRLFNLRKNYEQIEISQFRLI